MRPRRHGADPQRGTGGRWAGRDRLRDRRPRGRPRSTFGVQSRALGDSCYRVRHRAWGTSAQTADRAPPWASGARGPAQTERECRGRLAAGRRRRALGARAHPVSTRRGRRAGARRGGDRRGSGGPRGDRRGAAQMSATRHRAKGLATQAVIGDLVRRVACVAAIVLGAVTLVAALVAAVASTQARQVIAYQFPAGILGWRGVGVVLLDNVRLAVAPVAGAYLIELV